MKKTEYKIIYFVCRRVFKTGLGKNDWKQICSWMLFSKLSPMNMYIQLSSQKRKKKQVFFYEEKIWNGTFPWQSQRLAQRWGKEKAQWRPKIGFMQHRLKWRDRGNSFLLCKSYQWMKTSCTWTVQTGGTERGVRF